MSYQQILELIDRVAETDLSLVEIESSGVRIRVERAVVQQSVSSTTSSMTAPNVGAGEPVTQPVSEQPPAAEAPKAKADNEDDASWHIITSPIVGTFYRSPNPESESFTEEGSRVSKGSVLCIIEAMKLFNEIESDSDGVIARIYPESGQPVEFGEKLFAIRK